LQKALLRDGDFRGGDFTGADLTDASFENADLRGAIFEGTKLDNSLLDGSKIASSMLPIGSFAGISARWFDISLDGTGRNRVEISDDSLFSALNDEPSIRMAFTGSRSPKTLLSFSAFLSLMETMLPNLSLSIMRFDGDIDINQLITKINKQSIKIYCSEPFRLQQY
jgi:hypothetical protein